MNNKHFAGSVARSCAFATLSVFALPWASIAQVDPNLTFPYTTGIQLKNEDMSAAALDKAQATGARLVRKAIYWDSMETTLGVYNWTQPDAWVSSMEARGFSMIITLVWNNRLYEDIYDRAIVTEAGRQAFANWAADVADRYKGKNIVFEIWNEPNLRSFWHENAENVSNTDAMAEEYTELVKDAVPAMKAADPNCKVVVCSISALWTDSFNWFERCVEMGVLQTGIDGISVHPYGFRWPELAYQSGYPVIRQMMDSNGAQNLSIVTSEVGYPESWLIERGFTTANVEQAQAWMFVRQNLVDAMADIRGSIWYELTDASYGVLETNLAERPTFSAAQVLTAQLGGYTYVGRVPLPSGLDFAAIFENAAGSRKMVVWTTPSLMLPSNQRVEADHAVALPVGVSGSYDVVDTFGNVTTLNASGTELTVTIGGGPKYIPLKSQEIIIDNTGPGVTLTGTWTSSTADSSFYGSNYLHDGNTGKGTKSALFQSTSLSQGEYDVYVRWTAGANRSSAVPITVSTSAGSSSVTVNQKVNGGVWMLIGSYQVGSNGTLGVQISNTGTSGYVIADAVRFVPAPVIPAEVIVDNGSSTGFSLTGTWTAATSTAGYYGGNYLQDGNTGKGTKSALFQATVPSAGSYNLYLRWTSASNRASNVPVDISYSGGSDALSVDQRTGGGDWVLVGTYPMNANGTMNIGISNTATNGYVIVDAVRLVETYSAPAGPVEIILDNTQSASVTLTGAWTASTSEGGFYGTNYLHDGSSGKGTKTALFQTSVPAAGDYEVYMRWTAAVNRSDAVPVDITWTGGSDAVSVNQKVSGGTWVLLGTYTMPANASVGVLISNTGTTGYVIADAVRIKSVD